MNMCVGTIVYHRNTSRLSTESTNHVFFSVFCCLFVCFFVFRYEWSKFALFNPVSQSFLEVKGGCMSTVKTKGDSSQILKENSANTTYKFPQAIWLQSAIVPWRGATHSPWLQHKTASHFPKNVGVWNVWIIAKRRTSCKLVLHIEINKCKISFAIKSFEMVPSVDFISCCSETGLQMFFQSSSINAKRHSLFWVTWTIVSWEQESYITTE